jgi:hypothetical protein
MPDWFVASASSEASRAAWHQSLDRLASFQPDILVAGHKRSADAADTPASLKFMRDYLDEFELARRSAPNVQAMIDSVRAKYPDLHVPMLLAYSARMTFGK